MTFRDAAAAVLRERGPMHYRDLAEEIPVSGSLGASADHAPSDAIRHRQRRFEMSRQSDACETRDGN